MARKVNSNSYYDKTEFDKACDEFGASIRMIMGQRTNGKTYQVLKNILDNYNQNGTQGIYVRRWGDDLKSENIASLFSKHDPNVYYNRHAYYLDKSLICYTTALTKSEHFKGTTIPETVKLIMFDEIFPENRELPNEFAKWQSVLSTVVRDRDDVVVYMLGNTVRQSSCYLTHYNINLNKLKQGEYSLIEVRQKDRAPVKIGIDWCEKNTFVTRNSSKYIVDISSNNMLLEGKFESKEHRKAINGVRYENWYNANKLPISICTADGYYSVYMYKGVFIFVHSKRAEPYVYFKYRMPNLDHNRFTLYDTFPFASSLRMGHISRMIYEAVKYDQFVAASDGDAEIIQELLNVKGGI